jgi:hypothetical protein
MVVRFVAGWGSFRRKWRVDGITQGVVCRAAQARRNDRRNDRPGGNGNSRAWGDGVTASGMDLFVGVVRARSLYGERAEMRSLGLLGCVRE